MAYMITSPERSARAIGRNMSISSKQAIMIAAFLRGKKLDAAIATMGRVILLKQAIPFTRFANGLGHKPGAMAAGRYPVNAATQIKKLLENVKNNAAAKGLTGELRISHMAANRAASPARNRLKFRGAFKRTHVEIIVTEMPAREERAKEAKN